MLICSSRRRTQQRSIRVNSTNSIKTVLPDGRILLNGSLHISMNTLRRVERLGSSLKARLLLCYLGKWTFWRFPLTFCSTTLSHCHLAMHTVQSLRLISGLAKSSSSGPIKIPRYIPSSPTSPSTGFKIPFPRAYTITALPAEDDPIPL